MNGGLVDWPTGWGWYAYGAYFHQYLAERFGEERLVELAQRTAGRVPYTTGQAFKRVFGLPLGQLWREFQAAESAAAPARGTATGTRLTAHGYLTDAPRVDVDGTTVYTRRDAHDFPALMRLDGEHSARITSRFGGRTIAPAADAIYFDQLEFDGVVGLVSDLYRWDRATGTVRRLSRGARLAEPDVSPDGQRFAAIRVRDGARRLVIGAVAALERGEIGLTATIGDDHTVFATPRWSPDGTRIVAEYRRLGEQSQIALVDPSDATITVLTSGPRGRNVTPTWAPDDGRSIVFASDRDGTFQLYRLAVGGAEGDAGPERLTDVPGGARTPMFSPDGRSIVYVGYTTDGYDLFRIEIDTAPAAAPQTGGAPASQTSGPPTTPTDVRASGPYRPWSSLAPRLWLPIVENGTDEWRMGAATGGTDALGYHAWGAAATWSVLSPAELAPVVPGRRPNVTVSYAYARWRPTLFAQFTDETTPLLVGADDARRPLAIQERRMEFGTYVPFRRVRWRQAVLASYSADRAIFTGPRDDRQVDRGAIRLGWAFDSARRYGYSISRVDGVSAGVTTELARPGLGADGSATFTRADVRGFVPLWPRHGVLALRASGAASAGDATARRLLRLGGHQAEAGVMSFSEDATSLLRGFAANTFLGNRVALVNAEYRVPLVYVERGVRTWPVFLRSLHANAFLDVGHAWNGPFRWADRKWSWGGELAADTVLGYALPMTIAGGVAWGRDGAGAVPDTRRVYVRVGHGF
jgi:hypothetical protein